MKKRCNNIHCIDNSITETDLQKCWYCNSDLTIVGKPIDLDIGQKIYVNEQNHFLRVSEGNLIECEITKINKSVFYAKEKNKDYEYRFNRKTFTGKGVHVGSKLTAYLTVDQFNKEMDYQKERDELLVKIKKRLDELNLETLKDVNNFIK